jgi:hypothetical protein
MIWHPQMPKGSKTEFDKKELAPLAIAAGNNALTIQSRCRAVATSSPLRMPQLHHETAESRA